MPLFNPKNRTRSGDHRRVYALYEIWYTTVDFLAAGAFVLGSVLFLIPEPENFARWCFLVGSLLFAGKPTIRLARELQYLHMGDIDTLALRRRPDLGRSSEDESDKS